MENEKNKTKELDPEERMRLINKLNDVTKEFCLLAAIPENQRTQEEIKRMKKLAEEADDIQKKLSYF